MKRAALDRLAGKVRDVAALLSWAESTIARCHRERELRARSGGGRGTLLPADERALELAELVRSYLDRHQALSLSALASGMHRFQVAELVEELSE